MDKMKKRSGFIQERTKGPTEISKRASVISLNLYNPEAGKSLFNPRVTPHSKLFAQTVTKA
jgi:hypothetical protein